MTTPTPKQLWPYRVLRCRFRSSQRPRTLCYYQGEWYSLVSPREGAGLLAPSMLYRGDYHSFEPAEGVHATTCLGELPEPAPEPVPRLKRAATAYRLHTMRTPYAQLNTAEEWGFRLKEKQP